MKGLIQKRRAQLCEAGREISQLWIESRGSRANRSPDEWVKIAASWKELGATHISVNTMNAGLSSPDEHIDAIKRFKEAIAGV